MYNVAELATAVQHGIGVVVVVFDDGAFGNVKRIQHAAAAARSPPRCEPRFRRPRRELRRPRGTESPGSVTFSDTLDRAIASGGPALIDVPIGPQPDLWGLLTLRGLA